MKTPRVLSFLVLGVLSLYSLPFFAHAQAATTPQGNSAVLAQVGIRNCTFTQEGRTVSISCDFVNGDGVQPDVRYAVQLIQTEGTSTRALVDQYVYPDTLVLGDHQTLHKTISYMVPGFVGGAAELWMVASNSEGLRLAFNPLGKIATAPLDGYVQIVENRCYLRVSGEPEIKKYSIEQGVDIGEGEVLTAYCDVKNPGAKKVDVTSSITTHRRNLFGEIVTATGGTLPSLSLAPHETKLFSLELPRAADPQAYDAVLTLSTQGTVVSNAVPLHYVIQGATATVQNVVLDKPSYLKGQDALVTTSWTGSADRHILHRSTGTDEGAKTYSARITDGGGALCGETTQAVPQNEIDQLQQTVFKVSMQRDCGNPKVTVSVADASGKVLGQKSVSVSDTQANLLIRLLANGYVRIALGLLALVILVLLGVRIWRKRKVSGTPSIPPITPLLLLIAMSAGLWGSLPGTAHADTFENSWDLGLVSNCIFGGYDACDTSRTAEIINTDFTVDLDKTTYTPGEQILASAIYIDGLCTDGAHFGAVMSVTNNPNGQTATFQWTTNDSMLQKTATFTAPTTPGTYTVTFTGQSDFNYNGQFAPQPTSHSIQYTVASTPPPPPAQKPDLSADTPGNLTGVSGQSLSLSVVARNTGSVSTGKPFPAALWVTTDTASAGSLVKEYSGSSALGIPNGYPANYSEGVASNWTPSSAGTYYYRLCVDVNGSWGGAVIDESNESNNCGGWGAITVASQLPDLTATTDTSPNITTGQKAPLAGTVRNSPAASTGAGFKNLFQIFKSNASAGDYSVPFDNVTPLASTLAPNASQALSGTSNVAFNTAGTYYYRLCADYSLDNPASTIAESDEGNNCGAWNAITVTDPVPVPPSNLSYSCNTAGNQVTLSWTAPQYATKSYPRITVANGSECPSGWQIIDGTTCFPNPDGISATQVNNFPIVPGRTYTWWVHGGNAAGLSALASATFSCAAAVPDLTATTGAGSSITAGDSASLGGTIQNGGVGSANGTFNNLFQITAADQVSVVGNVVKTAGPIAPSGSQAISGSFTFNTPGTYYYRACADLDASWSGTVTEANEGNNCGAWAAITVIAPVPQPPTNLSYSCNSAGTQVSLSWTAATYATTYYPRVGVANASECPSGWQTTSDGGTCFPNPDSWTTTSVANFPIVPGRTYTWWVHSGNATGINWANPANGSFTCSGTTDLTASVGPAVSASIGQAATFTGTTRNVGTAATGQYYDLFIFYGADQSTWDSYQYTPLNGALGAGASEGRSVTHTFTTPGTYYYRLCADWNGNVSESNEDNNCSALQSITITDPNQPPVGYLDTASCTISGWAYDPNTPSQTMAVHLYVGGQAGNGGTFMGQATTGGSRADVTNATGVANTGWSFVVPESYRDGQAHPVYSYGIDTTDGTGWHNTQLRYSATGSYAPAYFTCAPTQPDLTADAAAPVSVTAGQQVTFTGTARNLNSVASTGGTGFWNVLQICDGSAGSSGGVGGNCSSFQDTNNYWYPGNLGPGATTPLSFTYSIPLSFSVADASIPGAKGSFLHTLLARALSPFLPEQALAADQTYYYRWCADWNVTNGNWAATVAQSDYSNDCGAWGAITVSAPDLTPVSLTPSTVVAGDPSTFTATLKNNGGATTPDFSSTIYVCPSSDSACIGNSMALADHGLWQKLLSFVRSVAEAATSQKVTLTGSPIPGNSTGTQTGSHTFSSPGSYSMRLCADLPLNQVSESNENDNCGDWQVLAVCPSGNSVDASGTCVAPTASCSPNATSVKTGDTVTYTASGSTGVHAPFTWLDSDGVTGSGSTFARTYTTPGTYSMQVKGANTGYAYCTAGGTDSPVQVSVTANYCVGTTPNVSISANPTRVKKGETSTITWSADNVPGQNATCTISGPGMATQVVPVGLAPSCAIASSSATPIITTQSVYTIDCGGTKAQTIVNVVPNPGEF